MAVYTVAERSIAKSKNAQGAPLYLRYVFSSYASKHPKFKVIIKLYSNLYLHFHPPGHSVDPVASRPCTVVAGACVRGTMRWAWQPLAKGTAVNAYKAY